jgi:arylsulfatase A-like enzyme
MTAPSLRPPSWPAVAVAAVWTGVLTGLGEVSLLLVQRLVLHRLVFQGADVIWMGPLGEAAIFFIVATLVWVVTRRLSPAARWQWQMGSLLWLAGCAVLFMYGPLHKGAAILLAGGIAFQGSRVLMGHVDGVGRLVRRTVLPLILLVGLSPVVLRAWWVSHERRSVHSLGPAREGAPNVLLIILDTVRAMDLGLYGGKATTRNLTRWAQRGVIFERAVSTAPWTLSSHASIMTGRFPDELSTDWLDPLDRQFPTLAETLAARGYSTAGFVANVLYCSRETGLARGFSHYEDYPVSSGVIIGSASLGRVLIGRPVVQRLLGLNDIPGRKNAHDIDRSFLHWLDGKATRSPFFAFLNFYDAHSPYLPAEPYAGRFGAIDPRENLQLHTQTSWPAAEVERHHNAYDAAIAYLDVQLDSLFISLERRGLLSNTIVIVTSDHGEEFYEHHVMGHGSSLYFPSLGVPLVMWGGPGLPRVRVKDFVTLKNLSATILDLAGAGPGTLPGQSLRRHWLDTTTAHANPDSAISAVNFASGLPASYPVSQGALRSLVLDRYQYILHADQSEELYDLVADPLEVHDLAQSVAVSPIRDSLRSDLKEFLRHTDRGRHIPIAGVH